MHNVNDPTLFSMGFFGLCVFSGGFFLWFEVFLGGVGVVYFVAFFFSFGGGGDFFPFLFSSPLECVHLPAFIFLPPPAPSVPAPSPDICSILALSIHWFLSCSEH